MALSERYNFSNMKELEWVHIPGVDYVLKYKFFDDRYSILVTNLKEIFGENVDEDQVQQRFSELNAHAKMKTSVILRHLKESLDVALTGKGVTFECFEESVRMQVQFSVNKVFLTFNFEPLLLSTHQLKSHIIVPIISHALFTYQENVALKNKLSLLESNQSFKPDTLPDSKINSNDIDLMTHTNTLNEGVIIDSFLNVQRDMQSCFMERKATTQRNNVPEISTELPMKRERAELHYEEEEGGRESPELPVKREISSEELNGGNQVYNQSLSSFNLEKTKKKKRFQF